MMRISTPTIGNGVVLARVPIQVRILALHNKCGSHFYYLLEQFTVEDSKRLHAAAVYRLSERKSDVVEPLIHPRLSIIWKHSRHCLWLAWKLSKGSSCLKSLH